MPPCDCCEYEPLALQARKAAQLRSESFGRKKFSWPPLQGTQTCKQAFLLYFLSGLRNGFKDIGFRDLQELHDGLEKEILRMALCLSIGGSSAMLHASPAGTTGDPLACLPMSGFAWSISMFVF